MKRLIYVFAVLLALTFLIHVQTAKADEGKMIFGAQAGEVGLSQDVGTTYGNALGLGAFFDYAVSDFLEFELGWLTSHHSGNGLNLNQNAFSLDVVYDVDQFDVFTPYLVGGAEFVTHTQDIVNPSNNLSTASYNTTGFGLNIGAGAKIDLGKNFITSLDFRYHNMFTATTTPPGSASSVNTIESYFTVLLRFGFAFGGTGDWLNRK